MRSVSFEALGYAIALTADSVRRNRALVRRYPHSDLAWNLLSDSQQDLRALRAMARGGAAGHVFLRPARVVGRLRCKHTVLGARRNPTDAERAERHMVAAYLKEWERI